MAGAPKDMIYLATVAVAKATGLDMSKGTPGAHALFAFLTFLRDFGGPPDRKLRFTIESAGAQLTEWELRDGKTNELHASAAYRPDGTWITYPEPAKGAD